jgi:ATP-dependent RNA helicase RhlE
MQIRSFSDLQLIEPLRRALEAESYVLPTPIQLQAIPHLLAGRDLLGCAQTGTGKTAAFALPVLQRLAADRRPGAPRVLRALVLSPTRELAAQIAESFRTYGRHLGLTSTTVFGGVGAQSQIRELRRGVDILVATPGRLLDLMSQGHLRFQHLQVLVLDEADRMLDMGFIRDVRKILAALPKPRQTALFSATMPEDILDLARSVLVDPIRVSVTPVASTVERIDQRVLFVDCRDKPALLASILTDRTIERAIVFARTKHGANRIATRLVGQKVSAEAIHGNKSQGARERTIDAFRRGRVRVLVATDIVARGIDVDGITHVINFDLPTPAESYVHRIGRTARAGASGIAMTFCAKDEIDDLRRIERLTQCRLRVVGDHPFASRRPAAPAPHRLPTSARHHEDRGRVAAGAAAS